MVNKMKTTQVTEGRTIVVWFFSDRLIEVLTAPGINNPAINDYIRGLLARGAVYTSSGQKIWDGFTKYAVLLPSSSNLVDRITFQKKMSDGLRSLGYEVIREHPDDPFPQDAT